jgi:hypothetical protein
MEPPETSLLVEALVQTVMDRLRHTIQHGAPDDSVIDTTAAPSESIEAFGRLVSHHVVPRVASKLEILPLEALVATLDAGFGLGATRIYRQAEQVHIEVNPYLDRIPATEADRTRELLTVILNEFTNVYFPQGTVVAGASPQLVGVAVTPVASA